jgi:protein-disulfide isomerase
MLKFVHCSLLLSAFFVVGCKAQSQGALDAKTSERVEAHIREQLKVPATVSVTFGERKASDFAGYDTLPVTFKNASRESTVEFLLSKDTNTLVRMDKMDVKDDLLAKKKAENERIAATIDVKGRAVLGNRNAKVTIVNYDDFECPFCQRMHGTLMNEVAKTYGDKVKIIYKDYPLTSIHPWAMRASINANCLAAQKNDAYWEFANVVHSNLQSIKTSEKGERRSVEEQKAQLDKFARETGTKFSVNAGQLEACIKAQDETEVRRSMAEAEKLGVDSTPTLFINGEVAAGAYPFEALKPIIDRALKNAGESVPEAPKPAASTPPPSTQK